LARIASIPGLAAALPAAHAAALPAAHTTLHGASRAGETADGAEARHAGAAGHLAAHAAAETSRAEARHSGGLSGTRGQDGEIDLVEIDADEQVIGRDGAGHEAEKHQRGDQELAVHERASLRGQGRLKTG
jgi:hypothetical protein